MATGDQNDVYNRLVSVLPSWFGDVTPGSTIGGLLQGLAWAGAFVYSLVAYAALQTRIKTATDGWLDMIAGDFFGLGLQRRPGQSDVSYRAIIIASILRERATKAGISKVLQDVTGRTPVVFEPRRPLDTGAYGFLYGYGSAGGYSTLSLPLNAALVTAFRPTPGSQQDGVQDADIYAAVDGVKPVGTTVWVNIQN